MNKKAIYILSILLPLLPIGCTNEIEQGTAPNSDTELYLKAVRSQIITRSGEQDYKFADGTKFDLYALDASMTGNDKWTNSPIMNNLEGTQVAAQDKIDYGNIQSFEGKTLNIYAATYGTTENPGKETTYIPITSTTGPRYTLSTRPELPGIPDLLRAKYIGATGNDGQLTLEFKHTLSKLTFEVAKQDETDQTVKLLDNIYLKSVSLIEARTNGTLDMESGAYMNLTGSDPRPFFTMPATPWLIPDNNKAQTLTTANDGKSGTDKREIYIFPNATPDGTAISGEDTPLKVKVVLGKTNDSNYNKEIIYPINEVAPNGTSINKPFRFKPNYEYLLTITVYRDDIRLISINPQVYDWIPAFSDGDKATSLGHPVSFGGLMWMDRNLGAESADCTTAANWYNTLGYYYQHGRNIPFIMDKEKFKTTVGDNNTKI